MRTLFLYEEKTNCPWIGDRCSLEVLTKGLQALGYESTISGDVDLIDQYDHIVLSNISSDLTPLLQILRFKNRSYSLIPFHEDFLLYTAIFRSFYAYVANALLTSNPEEGIAFLEYMPEIVHYHSFEPKKNSLINHPVMASASVCIANSFEEEKIIQRYCPIAKTSTIFWTSGYADEYDYSYSDSFIKKYSLQKKNYILQIGRISPRKNQLATILATRNIDIPLVFVATGHFNLEDDYFNSCIEATLQFRKAPTIFITNAKPAYKKGSLEIINAEGGISKSELISAYQNASVYCHPAFYELPGYVYLEAAKLGTPTVATKWCTLKDYFTDVKTGSYTLDDRIEYVLPYDIKTIQTAIETQMKKSFDSSDHPIFSRTQADVAKEFLKALDL